MVKADGPKIQLQDPAGVANQPWDCQKATGSKSTEVFSESVTLGASDARYVLASSDGELVVVRNCGAIGALIPLFETRSAGPYAFLNTGKFSSSDPGSAGGGVKITFYELK